MKLFRTILFFVCAGTGAVRAEIPPGWSTNYIATVAEASAKQEPMLVYFTASWCGPCKLMSQITLTDPALEQILADTRHVAVDIDEHSDLAAKSNVNAVPTFLLLTAGGDVAERTTGFQPISDFLPWLTNSVFTAKAAAKQLARHQSQLVDVDQRLASTNSEMMRPAALELFDLCAARNEMIVQSASARLQTLAALHPLVVLDGLNDPRLATRIQVANVLRMQIGETFDVDVWNDAFTRAKAVEEWGERLALVNGPAKAP